MNDFLGLFSKLTCVLALSVSLLYTLGAVFDLYELRRMEAYRACRLQLLELNIASIVFIALRFLAASGSGAVDALFVWQQLSVMCRYVGGGFIACALINIICSIILSISRASAESRSVLRKLRITAISMGTVNLIISFILKVN